LVFLFAVQRKMSGSKRQEVREGSRKLQNEGLYNLYASQCITRVIISRRLKWAGHVTHMGEKIKASRFLLGKPEGKGRLGRLKRIRDDNINIGLKVIERRVWAGLMWLRTGTSGWL
jgi:hypothetical protein